MSPPALSIKRAMPIAIIVRMLTLYHVTEDLADLKLVVDHHL
jgi:hypothetical protein